MKAHINASAVHWLTQCPHDAQMLSSLVRNLDGMVSRNHNMYHNQSQHQPMQYGRGHQNVVIHYEEDRMPDLRIGDAQINHAAIMNYVPEQKTLLIMFFCPACNGSCDRQLCVQQKMFVSQFRKPFPLAEVQYVPGVLLRQQPRNFVEIQQHP